MIGRMGWRVVGRESSKCKTSVHDSGDFSPIRIICEVIVSPLGIFAMELKYG